MIRFPWMCLASLGLVCVSLASAQDTLPTCRGADVSRWHNCRGILDEAEFSYAGDFRNGKFEGRGILEFTGEKYQGDHYQGEFKSGLKHGFGVYFFSNGEKYAGHYVNGMRHGFGTYTFNNGRAPLSGVWSNNQWTGKASPVSEERAEQKKNSKPLALDSTAYEMKPRGNSMTTPDMAVLIIGIETYQGLNKALYAANDANLFHDLMRDGMGVPPENIKLLSDHKATRSDILSALKFWLPAQVKAGKTHVYILFSGHGLTSDEDAQKYWLPFDVNKELLAETAVSEKWALAELQKLQAKSITIFLDSCYSGLARKGESLDPQARGIQFKSAVSPMPSNVTMVSASAANQTALASDDLKQGIFSYFLVRGLAGQADTDGNQRVTQGELIDYLSQRVDKKAMSMNRRQQPQLMGDRQRAVFP
jgi:hypothetical protein